MPRVKNIGRLQPAGSLTRRMKTYEKTRAAYPGGADNALLLGVGPLRNVLVAFPYRLI